MNEFLPSADSSVSSTKDLVGQTFRWVLRCKGRFGDDQIRFHLNNWTFYSIYNRHERFAIDEMWGNFADLEGTPVVSVELISNPEELFNYEVLNWTLLKISTARGSVSIRWVGESDKCSLEELELIKHKKSVDGTCIIE